MIVKAPTSENIRPFHDYFKCHYHEMLAFARYITKDYYLAEDVIQEAFLKAYQHHSDINDSSKWKAWIKTIVKRTAIDCLRKEHRIVLLEMNDITENYVTTTTAASFVEEALDRNISYEQLHQAIYQLQPILRTVLYLKLQNELADKEIAQYLNISLSAVKTRLYRARKQLRQLMNMPSLQ
ncbi:RNA polymerase sigma factor YlaC [Paraliobacillus ryukyuensis]|uniref:RNA polymerase sigma factor n=1 Tax=Paraliobacillus ryukyuensis TaxID=200904 RepID=A0A366DWX0_9BACI|nr:RNA polymerase sigma factor [Paraliobacillus ryukyuensis]RBO94552.1 RNA polymerase sigma-70 factor (ECF subfamily) [Paraliobacillus ryukyuensis]